MDWLRWVFETEAYRYTCLREESSLRLGYALSDGTIALAYLLIAAGVLWLAMRRKHAPYRIVPFFFAAFIFLCGGTHVLKVLMLYWPAYNLSLVWNYATGAVSMTALGVFFLLLPKLAQVRSTEEAMRGLDSESAIAGVKRAADALRKRSEGRPDERAG